MEPNRIGVIGGSGLYDLDQFGDCQEVTLMTPFGEPSDAYVLGEFDGVHVAFLSRHGRGHRYNPTEIPYRANLYGFKSLGVQSVISVGAVGSLREKIRPLDMVVPDQFFDRTQRRTSSFFTDGVVGHVAFADPVCPQLSSVLADACDASGCNVHRGGTYLCMEGPQFSTRSESNLYRAWGMHVIGMTNLTEAKLAREAEICYATLALVCDYDCWHQEHADVSAEMVLGILQESIANAKRVVVEAVKRVSSERRCACGTAMRNAVLSDPAQIPMETRRRLGLLLDKYLEA